MVLHRHAVIAQDIDLLGDLLTSEQPCLCLVHLRCPVVGDMLGDKRFKLGILDILGVGLNRVDGRVAFLVGTLLLQGVEASCHLLGVLRHRLLQVTTCRRYGADEGDGALLSVVEGDMSGAAVEVGDDG